MREKPRVVCLAGSTRFRREYEEAFRREEHAGRVCLTVPCYKDDPCCKTAAEQAALDELHLAKIDMADEVLVVDAPWWRCKTCKQFAPCEGRPRLRCPCLPEHSRGEYAPYIGESTRREVAYAEGLGKPVRYLSREGGVP